MLCVPPDENTKSTCNVPNFNYLCGVPCGNSPPSILMVAEPTIRLILPLLPPSLPYSTSMALGPTISAPFKFSDLCFRPEGFFMYRRAILCTFQIAVDFYYVRIWAGERGRESILYGYSWNFNCKSPTPHEYSTVPVRGIYAKTSENPVHCHVHLNFIHCMFRTSSRRARRIMSYLSVCSSQQFT
jgi:hypothetical protein